MTSPPLRRDSARARRPRWKPALITVAVLSAALLAGEIGLRVALEPEQANRNYWGRGAFVTLEDAGWRHAPGYRGRLVREGVFEHRVEISAEGLRQADVDHQLAFPRRLLVLGDSYTFGLGVEEHEAYPARLAEHLNRHGIGVINGGQTGYCVDQELTWARHLLPRVEPHAVLVALFLSNDLPDDLFALHRDVEVVDGYRLSANRLLPGPPVDALRTHSYLWMNLRGRMKLLQFRLRRRRYHRMVKESPERVVAASMRPLAELRDLCARRGAELYTTTIPSRRGELPLDQRFAAALSEHGIPHLDLAGALREEHHFDGDDHWNPEGHRTAARELAPFLLSMPALHPPTGTEGSP